MEIQNSFEVPLPPAEAWKVLLDIERIAPCLPGAELTGIVDSQTYEGKVSVRLGPVALAFAGQVKFEEIDHVRRKARAKAEGRDSKGRGSAHAKVEFAVLPSNTGSKVEVRTDLRLAGAVAQYGRASGLIQEVATQLIGEFAAALKAQLERGGATGRKAAVAIPISGLSLVLKALWNALRRLFGGGTA